MPNRKMDAIQVEDAVMGKQRTFAPGFKLLDERLIEPTDRARTGSDSHQGLSDFTDFMRTCPDFQTSGSVLRLPLVHSGCSARTLHCERLLPDLLAPSNPQCVQLR